MLIRDEKGQERVAYAPDFQDVTITLTPMEWQELRHIFEYSRERTKPNPFSKLNKSIYEKLKANQPPLKPGLEEIKQEETNAE